MSLQEEKKIEPMGADFFQSEPALTVCIVTYNRREDVARALASVYDNITLPDVEVIVVDNHSTDDTVKFIQEKYPRVEIIRSPINQGYAPAMNLALARSKGKFVLTLSHDAELKAGTIEAFVKFMSAHSCAGLAGPRMLDARGEILTSLHHPNLFLNIWSEIIPIKPWLRRTHLVRSLLTKFFPNSSGLTSDYSVTHPVPVLDGGCLFIRRELLNTIGLLDPLIPQGPDDYDWCYRAHKQGFEIWFIAESEVLHRASPKEEFSSLSPIYLRLRMPQYCYLYSKYHDGLSLKLFRLSAVMLIWKWRYQAWRLYGARSEYDDMLKDGLGLCLNLKKYRDVIERSQIPSSSSAVSTE